MNAGAQDVWVPVSRLYPPSVELTNTRKRCRPRRYPPVRCPGASKASAAPPGVLIIRFRAVPGSSLI